MADRSRDRPPRRPLPSTRERLIDDLAWDIESLWYALPLVAIAAIIAVLVGTSFTVVVMCVAGAAVTWRCLVAIGRRIRRDR